MRLMTILEYILPYRLMVYVSTKVFIRQQQRAIELQQIASKEMKEWIASNNNKFQDMCKESLSVAPSIELNGKKAPTLDELIQKRTVRIVKRKDKKDVSV